VIRAYLDTNVLISYIWNESYQETDREKSDSHKVVNLGAQGNYEIFISEYNLMEIHEHFTDYYLQQNAIRDGFGFREFPKVRREYTLTKEQAQAVVDLIERLRASPFLNYIEPGGMTEGFFKSVMDYVKRYIDFVDAAHLRTAIDTNCDYFVTNDGELRTRAQRLLCDHIITEDITLASASGFLEAIERKITKHRTPNKA
jgi:predicted nucleic acid-binding protein